MAAAVHGGIHRPPPPSPAAAHIHRDVGELEHQPQEDGPAGHRLYPSKSLHSDCVRPVRPAQRRQGGWGGDGSVAAAPRGSNPSQCRGARDHLSSHVNRGASEDEAGDAITTMQNYKPACLEGHGAAATAAAAATNRSNSAAASTAQLYPTLCTNGHA